MEIVNQSIVNTLIKPGARPDHFTRFEIRAVRDFYIPGEDCAAMHVIKETERELLEDDAEWAAGPVKYGVFGVQTSKKWQFIRDFETISDALNFFQRLGILS